MRKQKAQQYDGSSEKEREFVAEKTSVGNVSALVERESDTKRVYI